MHRITAVPALLALLAIVTFGVPARAQSWTLLGGAGGIDYEGSLGPAIHLNARRTIASWSEVRLGPPSSGAWEVPAFHLESDLIVQAGRSGTKIRTCSGQEAHCSAGADPLFLLGAGIASKIEMTKPERALQLYFLPLSATLFLQSGELFEGRLGSFETERERESKITGGIGNGAGIRLRLGEVIALLEIRAIIARDLEGGRSGSLPISIGVSW